MSPKSDRPLRTAAIVLALVMVTVFCGYQAGKQMAQRDNARAAAAS